MKAKTFCKKDDDLRTTRRKKSERERDISQDSEKTRRNETKPKTKNIN